MKIDANDPRWTAYALGELEDEKERAELESVLQQSEAMRLLVEEIRQTAGWLNEGLKDESSFGLTQAQRERIESQSTKKKSWLWAKPAWTLATAAALFALGLSFWVYELEIGKKKIDSQVAQIMDRLEQLPAPDSLSRAEIGQETGEEIPAQSAAAAGPSEAESKGARTALDSEPLSSPELEREKEEILQTPRRDIAQRLSKPPGKDEGAVSSNEKSKGQGIGTKAISSRGAILHADAVVKEQPKRDKDAKELAGIMGSTSREAGNEPAEAIRQKVEMIRGKSKENQSFAGVTPESLDIERDGITVSDARYGSGMASLPPPPIGGIAASSYASAAASSPSPGSGNAIGRGWGPPPPPRPRLPREDWPGYRPDRPAFNTEGYASILDNPFLDVVQNPLSTFSIDVDTASYANVRRFLEQSQLPPKDAVRIEELVNYFDYEYEGPGREGPFAAHFEMTEAPWNREHRLLRIGLKAREIESRERPKTNLVFLIDVSGSMSARNKLPLVQDAMHMLVDRLTENDHVSIVTYAGSTRVELPSTRGDEKWNIHRAIDRLRSGGSTAGASGIQLAYETAKRNFIKGGANRVILATDGDFNVGITNHGDLARFIEEKADSGVFLSALGFGMGNYKDDTLELLASRGRGNYAYIDTIEEARKVLVDEIDATLVSVAKDVKIQVEFNPGRTAGYRLIGYEDRIMPKEDFNNDAKKAGVIGAGHAVTALYEIVPAGKPVPSSGVDPLKYQKPVETTRATSSREVGTVKIRYKEPDGEESRLMQFAVEDSGKKFDKASGDFKFAASVAAFGMVLRDSPYKGSATLEDALAWAKEGRGEDPHGYREDFIRLLHRAVSIKR